MSPSRTIRAAGAALMAAATLSACSDSSTAPDQALRPVTLSVATTGSATVGGGSGIGVGGVIAVGGGELVITKAQLVLREIELEGPAVGAACGDSSSSSASLSVARFSGSDDGSDDDSSHDEFECGEIELGPVLLDLPLGAGVTQEIAVQVPEGTYHEIKFKLREPDDDAAGRAFAAANPTFANISVRVEGTYNGEPFTFTSAVRAEQEIEFHPYFTVGAGGTNVTLRVNVASWFTDGSGAAIDPATAQPGGSNRAQVESHIVSSFQAYEDRDRDGDDDSHEDDSDSR